MCKSIVEKLVGYQNRTNVCSLYDITHKSDLFSKLNDTPLERTSVLSLSILGIDGCQVAGNG